MNSTRYFSYVLSPERPLPWPVTASEAVGILATYVVGLAALLPGSYWALSTLIPASESVVIALAVVFLVYTYLFRALIRRVRPRDADDREALARQD